MSGTYFPGHSKGNGTLFRNEAAPSTNNNVQGKLVLRGNQRVVVLNRPMSVVRLVPTSPAVNNGENVQSVHETNPSLRFFRVKNSENSSMATPETKRAEVIQPTNKAKDPIISLKPETAEEELDAIDGTLYTDYASLIEESIEEFPESDSEGKSSSSSDGDVNDEEVLQRTGAADDIVPASSSSLKRKSSSSATTILHSAEVEADDLSYMKESYDDEEEALPSNDTEQCMEECNHDVKEIKECLTRMERTMAANQKTFNVILQLLKTGPKKKKRTNEYDLYNEDELGKKLLEDRVKHRRTSQEFDAIINKLDLDLFEEHLASRDYADRIKRFFEHRLTSSVLDERLQEAVDIIFETSFLRQLSWTGFATPTPKIALGQYPSLGKFFKSLVNTTKPVVTDKDIVGFFMNVLEDDPDEMLE